MHLEKTLHIARIVNKCVISFAGHEKRLFTNNVTLGIHLNDNQIVGTIVIDVLYNISISLDLANAPLDMACLISSIYNYSHVHQITIIHSFNEMLSL